MAENNDKIIEKLPQTLRWENSKLYILDQTKLPIEVNEEQQNTIEQVWQSIKMLKAKRSTGYRYCRSLRIALRNKR